MLGGSIGIAMTASILANWQRDGLFDVVSPAQIANLSNESMKRLTRNQQAVIRHTYNGAFTETMKICAIIAGIGIIITTGTYRRKRKTMVQQRADQVQAEIERRHMADMQKEPASSKSSGTGH